MDPKLFLATKAFIVHNGKVLLLREAGSYQDAAHVGKYDTPGGRLKPGEKWDEALTREVMEETGLDVHIGRPIAVSEWRPVVRGEPWQIVGVFFECTASSADVKLSTDHDAFVWIDPKDYRNQPMIENLRPVFAEYVKGK